MSGQVPAGFEAVIPGSEILVSHLGSLAVTLLVGPGGVEVRADAVLTPGQARWLAARLTVAADYADSRGAASPTSPGGAQ